MKRTVRIEKCDAGWLVNGVRHGVWRLSFNIFEIYARGRIQRAIHRGSIFTYPDGPYRTDHPELGILMSMSFQGIQYKGGR